MNITLQKPIAHVAVLRTPVQLDSLSLEFVLVNPLEKRLSLKVQPINQEITINGPAYEEIQPALEKALAKILGPVIDAALNPPAPVTSANQ